MKRRAERAQRMLHVLKQLHRIEEFKKIELQHRLAELEHSQHEVILALNTDDALHGLFVDTTAKFLTSLAKEAQKVAEAKEVQSQRLLEQTSKLKHAERLNKVITHETRKAESERQLLEAIERAARRSDTSSP